MVIIRITLFDEQDNAIPIENPGGWVDCESVLTRHPDFYSLVESYETPLEAYGPIREIVLNLEKQYGPDAEIKALIEYSKDGLIFQTLFFGLMPIAAITEQVDVDHTAIITFDQQGIWTKFINRYDTPVNIQSTTDLDGSAVPVLTPQILKLPSQIINLYSNWNGHAGPLNTADDCVTATTSNITLAGLQVVGGVAVTEFMRVLVKNQSDPSKNGLHNASALLWTRTVDANTHVELENIFVTVTKGSQAGNYVQTTTPIVLGTTAISFRITDYVDTNNLMALGFTSGSAGPNHIEFQAYSQFTANQIQSDIPNTFSYDTSFISKVHRLPLDPTTVFNLFEIQQLRGQILFNFNCTLTWYLSGAWTTNGGTVIPKTVEIKTELVYRLNDDVTEIVITTDNYIYNPGYIGTEPPGSYDFTAPKHAVNINVVDYALNVVPGDIVFCYLKYTVTLTYFNEGDDIITWNRLTIYGGLSTIDVTFTFKSLYPDSTTQGFLIHDLLSSVVKRIAGDFYSPVLGRINTLAKTYPANGCKSPYIVGQGLQFRGYTLTEKPYSISAKDVWEGFDPIENIGLGYDVVDGVPVIEVSAKEDYFDDSEFSVLLSNVRKISRAYDQDFFYSSIKNGYAKSETASTGGGGVASGLDEVQTNHTRASRFKYIGKALQKISSFIAGSLTIESTRRTVASLSANYKYDNDNMIIRVEDSTGSFNPVLDQNFSSVTGILDESLRYNKDITPARNFGRWLNFFSLGMYAYLTSAFKFVAGEGNVNMVSTRSGDTCNDFYAGVPLAENADIQVAQTVPFIPIPYTIVHEMTIDEYKKITAKRKLAIGISQTTKDHAAFFIKTLNYKSAAGELTLVAWPKKFFEIKVVQSSTVENEDTSLPDTRIHDYEFNDIYS